MKLPASVAAAIAERETARAAFEATQRPPETATAIARLAEQKRAGLETADAETRSRLLREIARLEVAHRAEAVPARQEDADEARRAVISTNAKVAELARQHHVAQTRAAWDSFGKALSAAFDALDTVANHRSELQGAAGVGVKDGKLDAARQLACSLADAVGAPVRARSPQEAA